MTKLPGDFAIPSEVLAELAQYTSFRELDQVLSAFHAKVQKDEITLTIDAKEAYEAPTAELICESMETVLAYVRKCCRLDTGPNKRAIKVQCRNLHNKLFVRIEFTCESATLRDPDRKTQKIRRRVEKIDGYMQFKLEKGTGIVQMALPLEYTEEI